MALPLHGVAPEDVLGELERFRSGDLRWKDGRVFSLTYYAGPEAYALANEAYARFSSENMLNLDAFPSLRKMQNEVVATVCELLGGDEQTVGVFTSGGTESILTAVKGARQWARSRGIADINAPSARWPSRFRPPTPIRKPSHSCARDECDPK